MLRCCTIRCPNGPFGSRRAEASPRRARCLAAALILSPVIAGFTPVFAQSFSQTVLNGARPTWQEDRSLLQDPAATAEARAGACRRLVGSPEPGAIDAVVALLGPESRTTDLAPLVLREIGALPSASPLLLDPLAAWLKESTPDRHPALYRAISSIRTRDAARLLLSYVTASTTSENRDAVFQSLARLTGRHDLAADREAWSRWLTAMDALTEEQWRSALASNLAFRADALRMQRDEAIRRLTESERARALAAPDVATRSALFADLLRDDLPVLRRLGIELVNRDLANAKEIGPEVGTATLELLKDPSADVRSAAADLVDRLVPNGASIALRDALDLEQDPNVLAKLIRLVRRFPEVAPPEMLVGWFGADIAVRRAAIDAVAAMQAAGFLASSIDLDRALRTLRSEQLEGLSQDGLKLLCELGDESDREAVAKMLQSASADARLRAAQALAPFPDRLEQILAAASNDPTLFSVAAAALAKHRPTIEGFRSLQTLRAPTAAALREATNALCQLLPLPDLTAAAREIPDASTRETILSRVVNLTVPTAANGTDPGRDPFKGETGPSLVEALIALARAQLELTRPGAAIGTLDLLPPEDAQIRRAVAPLRVEAYLYLDQIEQALLLESTPDAWLDGMAYAVSLPHALAIGSEIEYQFGNELTPTQRARLDELTREARKPRGPRESSASSR
jgi:hypothetical protein